MPLEVGHDGASEEELEAKSQIGGAHELRGGGTGGGTEEQRLEAPTRVLQRRRRQLEEPGDLTRAAPEWRKPSETLNLQLL